jgi:uncharacterized protein (UPF0216 family)
MTEALDVVVSTREGAHRVATLAYENARMLIADGKRARIRTEEAEDEITIRQRGFLHAAVLPQIAEQVMLPDGARYTAKVWKEHLKELFIPDRWDMIRLPFVLDRKTGKWKPSKRKVPVKRRKSTEDLSIKGYSEFIDRSIMHAAAEWGVQFRFIAEERDAVRWSAPARKRAEATV